MTNSPWLFFRCACGTFPPPIPFKIFLKPVGFTLKNAVFSPSFILFIVWCIF